MQNNPAPEKEFALKKGNDHLDIQPVFHVSETFENRHNYYGDAPSSQGDEKQQLFRILAALRKHWLLIVGITFLATALTVVYEAQQPVYYTAEARVQVNNETNPAAGTGGSSIVVANSSNDPAYFATQLQIIEGSGLLRRVVKNLDLEHNREFFGRGSSEQFTVWQNVLRMFGLYKPKDEDQNKPILAEKTKNELNVNTSSDINSEQEIEQLAPYVGYLQRSLKVSPVKDSRTAVKETRLIEIEFTHNDPTIAAKMVNTIAETYVLQNLEQKVQTNAAAGDFLQKRVAELQAAIREGEEKLINYGKSNQILSLNGDQNTVVQRLTALNTNLGAAENERIAAEAAYRAALQNPVADITAQSKDARTTALEGQLSDLQQQLSQLKLEYTDDWPEVIQVRQKIANVEKLLASSRQRTSSTQTASLEQTYREAFAKEKELRENFEKQRSEVLAQNEAAINYRIIQQEIDTNKSLLDGLLQRSKETDIILTNTPNNVLIVDRALVPRAPSGPQRTRNIMVALLASLLSGIGLAILLNWLNDKVTASEDLESQLGVPVLGIIPAAPQGIFKRLMPNKLALRRKSSVAENNYDMERFEDPIIAEAYLHLRTYLLLSTAGGPPQTVLVTSGQPGEGKTVTAVNLAKSLAQTGAKVLLIDGDLRYPRLHLANEIQNNKGLSNLLTVSEIDDELISTVVSKCTVKNLDILTAGPSVPNPANILGSSEMQQLLTRLKNHYAHIIIDSPPVLYFADSVILSTFVDAVTLVARCNTSTWQSLRFAKKKLSEASARVIGVVFNGVPLSNSGYHNYGYYHNGSKALPEGTTALNINQ